jgi:hypothetical protein
VRAPGATFRAVRTQGTPGTKFFIVESGDFALIVKHANDPDEVVHTYGRDRGIDASFGESALVSGSKPYGGQIVAQSDGATA